MSKRDFLIDNKDIYNLEILFLRIIRFITWTSLGLYIVGILSNTTFRYFSQVNFFVKIIIGIFIIYRFNSWRKHKIKFTELDRRVAYSAGFYIVLYSLLDLLPSTTTINNIIINFTKNQQI